MCKSQALMDIGLLLLRLTTGLTLAAHGAQKLFGWFGGPGLGSTAQFFEVLGFPPGRRHALMAGLVEIGGGLLLALGLITPFPAAAIICVMLVGAVSVHVKNGFFAQNGGYEYALFLGIAALTLAFTGPDSLSLDALLGHYLSGTFWGVAALLAGIIGGVIPLMQRRRAFTQQTAPVK